ncbi:MAG TPA: 50S ribosomal protein L29 [Patescibacteria group bacterium]|nr:50S ribosomal protein L29 [Patescibacteria group bacterium]
MKNKQKEELKARSIQELGKLIKDSEVLLFKLRLEKSQNKLKNLKSIFFERKKIALMLTTINDKAKLEKIDQKEKPKIKGKSSTKTK